MKITLPLTTKDIEKLQARDIVYLTGTIYTARDAAHQKIKELINGNKPLPINLQNQIIYYTGPTPSKDGIHPGSIGPTTSYRMDSYMEILSEIPIAATIGKGQRDIKVRHLAKEKEIIYFIAIGGIGAKLSKCVESIKCIAFEELGAEAIYELKIKDFPVIVGYDLYGNSAFKDEKI